MCLAKNGAGDFIFLNNMLNSDIEWIQLVADIQCQLYPKYRLSEEEVVFIDGMIHVVK